MKRPAQRRSSEIAIWPVREIESTSASGSMSGLDSGLSGRVEKSRQGSPSQDAPYTMDRPSGANRAERIVPRRKLSRWNDGSAEPGAVARSDAGVSPDAISERRSRTIARSLAKSRVEAYRPS